MLVGGNRGQSFVYTKWKVFQNQWWVVTLCINIFRPITRLYEWFKDSSFQVQTDIQELNTSEIDIYGQGQTIGSKYSYNL